MSIVEGFSKFQIRPFSVILVLILQSGIFICSLDKQCSSKIEV